MKKALFLLITGFLFLSSCKDEMKIPAAERGKLLETVLNGTLNKAEIIERVTELDALPFATYGVDYYAITYRTEYAGKPINSSGLLVVPKEAKDIRLIMYCHGTEIPSKTLGAAKITPSLYHGEKDTHRSVRNMGLGWASAGYTVFIPDYIGFGLTDGKDHPYVYYPEMFKSNIDGLLAVKEFFRDNAITYDNKLFIAGSSQGAGASLSAHKYIQESYSGEFSVAGSSGLAGPYNFTRFAEEILTRKSESIAVLPILSWGIY